MAVFKPVPPKPGAKPVAPAIKNPEAPLYVNPGDVDAKTKHAAAAQIDKAIAAKMKARS